MNNKILKKIARLSWLYPIIILIIIFIFGLYKGYSDETNNILIKNSENALKNNPSQNKIQVENNNVAQNSSQNQKLEEESNIKEKEQIKEKIKENGNYSAKEELAAYINEYKKLPPNYISKQDAIKAGWKQGEENLDAILPGMSIGGDEYGNFSDKLPKKDGRKYYEADVDYKGSSRNSKRIVYSNDGLIFYTEDAYETFERLY